MAALHLLFIRLERSGKHLQLENAYHVKRDNLDTLKNIYIWFLNMTCFDAPLTPAFPMTAVGYTDLYCVRR